MNRIVTAYLEFAEIQALDQKPMYMNGWIAKLDDFLKLSGRDLLKNAGSISHENALTKAINEYEKYKLIHLNDPSPIEQHFLESVKELNKIEKDVNKKNKK